MTWINNIVHPPELKHLARPYKKNIELPSKRRVSVTVNNLCYQLALLFADETLMSSDNLIFPDPTNPLEPPDYDNTPLGDINTGDYHKIVSQKECRIDKSELLLPFLSFIDGTLVANNSVEPIFLCPGIFKREIQN